MVPLNVDFFLLLVNYYPAFMVENTRTHARTHAHTHTHARAHTHTPTAER